MPTTSGVGGEPGCQKRQTAGPLIARKLQFLQSVLQTGSLSSPEDQNAGIATPDRDLSAAGWMVQANHCRAGLKSVHPVSRSFSLPPRRDPWADSFKFDFPKPESAPALGSVAQCLISAEAAPNQARPTPHSSYPSHRTSYNCRWERRLRVEFRTPRSGSERAPTQFVGWPAGNFHASTNRTGIRIEECASQN